MPAPNIERVRVVTSGLINGVQTWSFGQTYVPASVAAPTQSDLDSFNAAVQASLVANLFTAGTKVFWSTATTWEKVDSYYYPALANVAALHSSTTTGAPITGTGTVFNPTQTAIVCSVLTDIPSRRTRGRFYYPYTGKTLGAGHKVSNADVDTLCNAMAAHVLALQAGTPLAGKAVSLAVESQIGGMASLATKLSLNNEVDIQRRRADKILPTYAKVVLV
jgi:hypothetical protein